MSVSYSKTAKLALTESTEKQKKCCQRIYNDIMSLASIEEIEKRTDIIERSFRFLKCASCFGYLLRALFIVYGNVTDPAKSYHHELSFRAEEERDLCADLLSENGIDMKCTKRKNRFLLYVKDSALIEDFFAVIGANSLAFDLMNAKILSEVRGDANRQMNCDMANIKKTLSAAEKHIEIVSEMKQNGTFIRLPADLRETAEIRFNYDQASMAELGRYHNPPISKSGVKHRLDKLVDFYEDIKNKD